MTHLVRKTTRPPAPRTRLLVVRQPAKSVRHKDQPDRTPLRLTIGIIVTLGVVGLVWLMGYLGYRLGYAPMVGVPDLVGGPGGSLATGTMMLIRIPMVILQAGMAEPEWLMLCFALIAIPAAGLSAAAPATPGGPRPNQAVVVFSVAGAITAALNGAALIWWTVSPFRTGLMQPMPQMPALAESWHSNLQIAAGLDVLMVITAALWVVLVLRLAIPVWLRALSASVSFFALVVIVVAMSLSSAAAAQLATPRSLCLLPDAQDDWQLLLGSTPHHIAALAVRDDHTTVQLRNRRDMIVVQGTRSVIEYLNERAPEEE
ncbi:MAG: hypothetical protein JSV91_03705 [Phycisphaerales bacterium]|nr:MAG: hypothetical protein JSV91_03705 [Phycisphaerales bacterium]